MATGPAGLPSAGERPGAAAALARYALEVAEQAAAAMQTSAGELAAARWLDAEDATIRQALAWALEHDPDAALRLALALAPWWQLRGRLAAGYALLRAAAGHAAPGSDAVVRGALLAGPGCSLAPAISPLRWVTSPRSVTPWRAGSRRRCWPTRWRAGRRPW